MVHFHTRQDKWDRIPLSEVGEAYALDPINDLRPVCPNCHAMLHRKKLAMDIETLSTFLKQNQQDVKSDLLKG